MDVAPELAAFFGASAPELQNAVALWQEDPDGCALEHRFKVKSAASADRLEEVHRKTKLSGFTYDPAALEFTIVIDRNARSVTDAFKKFIESGAEDVAGGAQFSAGIKQKSEQAGFVGQNQFRGRIAAAEGRARSLGVQGGDSAARAERIRENVARAKRRLSKYRSAVNVGKRAKAARADLPVPDLSACAIENKVNGRQFADIREFGLWLEGRFERVKEFSRWAVGQIGPIQDAAMVGAGAPDVQNAVLLWQDDGNGAYATYTFRAVSDKAARSIADDFHKSGMQGFTYDPASREFAIAVEDPDATVANGITDFIERSRAAGNVESGGGAAEERGKGPGVTKGRFDLIFDSDYRGIIEAHQRQAAAGDARPADQGRAARANSLVAEVQGRLSAFEAAKAAQGDDTVSRG
jgi:hypothetical protein